MKKILFLFLYLAPILLQAQQKPDRGTLNPDPLPDPFSRHRDRKTRVHGEILPGADQTELYTDYLKGKNIGMVINQTSVIGKNHIFSLDSLLKTGLHIVKIFGPEHGFRGTASNGAQVG
ncbi:MAG TPA: exo-beta-N-acetylmuramidase NamZ domain-containing protein, partial [Mucilaginibacter sp.]|nr:exo-beta-N-acetylmuramidase NamZ domain-containing protein [Mucilaginibacter sp.]